MKSFRVIVWASEGLWVAAVPELWVRERAASPLDLEWELRRSLEGLDGGLEHREDAADFVWEFHVSPQVLAEFIRRPGIRG